jgi:superfamily II DNA helicase RecQ
MQSQSETTATWLVYHPLYEVLVCRIHGHAISNIATHLSMKHNDLNNTTRSQIIAKYSTLQLSHPPNTNFSHGPANPIPAIDGLTIRKGFTCIECQYKTISWKKLREHHRGENHNWTLTKTSVEHWAEVDLQTFFIVPGDVVYYFYVTRLDTNTAGREGGVASASRSGESQSQVVDDIMERWTHRQMAEEDAQAVEPKGADKHEITNWLKRTGWPAHFNGRDLREISSCSQMSGWAGDDDLRRLTTAMDRLFFARCIEGVKTMPLMTRLLLASPHPQDAHSQPFGPLQEKTSMDRYLMYWKRFLCYCMRVLHLDDTSLLEKHAFTFTRDQRVSLEKLWRHVQDEDWSENLLEEELLQVSASFWMQPLDEDPFASPLWHFIGVLAFDQQSGQLRPAHLFTYVLAGLVFVGRVLLAERAIPAKEREGMLDLIGRFGQIRNKWLCRATYSPMGYVLSLLLYGQKISRETSSRRVVSWNKQGELMYYMGKPIQMDDIRSMVAKMTVDAEDLLWGSLMFKEGDNARFTIPLAMIVDDLTFTQRGKSFVHRNGLAGKEVEMLKDLTSGPRHREFLDKNGQWRSVYVRRYLKLVQQFREYLLLLAHFTGGQPSRGEEITGLRLVDGINRDRNVFVIDGEVVLVTQYHKSLAHFDSPKVIPRFLPRRVGQLMVMYMVYIRPLTDRLEADRLELYDKTAPPSDFIWHGEGGPWESAHISSAMTRWTPCYTGQRITLQDWRHIAIAISKKLARKEGLEKADFEETDDDQEHYEALDDLAAGHSTQTSASHGVTIDVLKRLTAESLEVFGQVSHRWHRFLGLVEPVQQQARLLTEPIQQRDRLSPPPPPLRGKVSVSIGEQIVSKRPRVPLPVRPKASVSIGEPTVSKRPRVLPFVKLSPEANQDELILNALRTAVGKETAQFQTVQQEEAVRAAIAKKTPLVAVLPTGGGKSLIFMVPAMLPGAGVTIVVAPFAERKRQLITRCVNAGLDCKAWPEAKDSWPQVVIVSGEAASSDRFLHWAADLCLQGRLDRVVLDECHLIFTAAVEYRKRLRNLVLLRNLPCPFLFLTGTLPPLRVGEFEEALHLHDPLYIRASSHRINTQYSVDRVKSGQGVMMIKRHVVIRAKTMAPGEKGIIYCSSKAKCKALAGQIKCHYYHSASHDQEAEFFAWQEAGFQAWLRGEAPYIVATTALGTGIDVPGVVDVLHLEAPYSIIDYAQQAGRAERAGEAVTAKIVLEDRDWPVEDDETDSRLELKQREVNSFVRTTGCRRSILGRILDGDVRDCKRIKAVLCDNCQQQEKAWQSEPPAQGMNLNQARGRRVAQELEHLRDALAEVEELGAWGCRVCWVFKGLDAASKHKWDECPGIDERLSFSGCMAYQRQIDYRRDPQAKFLSCFYCHVTQELCPDGYKSKGTTCKWKYFVIPVVLAALTEETLQERIQELIGHKFPDVKEYIVWLGRKCPKLVCGIDMTNAMAVFNLVVNWRLEERVINPGSGVVERVH